MTKALQRPGAAALLEKYKALLATTEPFEAGPLEAVTRQFAESEEVKINDIIHAARVAVTGKSIGFGLFDSMAIVGRDGCLRRIEATLETR